MRASLLVAALLLSASPLAAQSVDRTETGRIADEGFNRSQIMQTAEYLMDRIGPRLTNSPGMRQAEEWTQAKFREWGLKNVHKEGFDFGRGWWIQRSSVRMTSPRPLELTAIPIAWTPATRGKISAPVIVAPMSELGHFARWHGKLAGKIVMVTLPGEGSEP